MKTAAVLGLLGSLGLATAQVDMDAAGTPAWLDRVQKGHEARKAGEDPDDWWLKTCAGWSAHILCSSVFNSGFPEDVAIAEDVTPLFISATITEVDYEDKSVSSVCTWDVSEEPYQVIMKAIHREGVGCTLVEGYTEEEIRRQPIGDISGIPKDPNTPWPRGEGMSAPASDVDIECVNKAAQDLMGVGAYNVRGIAVAHRNTLIYESYAEHVDKDTALIGWSATKTITGMLMGIVAAEQGLDYAEKAPVYEWVAPDPKANITLGQMMKMTSGTQWGGGAEDVLMTTQCLFNSQGDCAHDSAENLPLLHVPGEYHEYNSGSTYILSRLSLENRREQDWTMLEWPARKLFRPIGANSFFIEPQGSQHYLGGAMGFGTCRDWARLGQLMLNDGMWEGRRILPEGYVRWATTGTDASNGGPGYGAQVRLNNGRGSYYMTGFRNQQVFMYPEHELVVVKLAMPDLLSMGWDQGAFEDAMTSCFPRRSDNEEPATTASQ